MADKFTIHTVEDSGEYYHCVYESQTNQLIDYFFFEDDAKEEILKLEKGVGFDGFTPSFMLNTSHVNTISPDNINKKFTNIFSK